MTSWIVFSIPIFLFGGFYVSADNLALLSGTLRTYQRAGCDDEVVTLKCPPGTSISIEIAQYGKTSTSESLCSPRSTASPISRTSYNFNVSCIWPNAIQTVVETCQKKRQCKFQTNTKTFGGDPCPGIRKYVEVAYKCRPYEFRSKVACENERIQLKCNPNSRVAVYSASYGRTEYESIQCPQPQGVPEEIPRKVLKDQYDGGLEKDETDVDTANYEEDDFDIYDAGNEYIRESAASPPAPNVEGIAKDNFTKDINSINSKKTPNKFNGLDFASYQPYTTPRSRSRSRTNPSRPRVPSMRKTTKDTLPGDIHDPNCTITVYVGSDPSEKTRVIGFLSEWINAYTFISQNKERFFLYLIISVAAGLLLLLSFLVGRLLLQRHRAQREAKFHATNVSDNTVPNGFTDDISEVDADIDLTLPCPVPSVTIHSPPMGSIAEVVRYPHVHTHTFRRPIQMVEADIPRSMSSASNQQYYYG